ncbi:hypothetical protein PYW07_006623 [Mythimna separata]|uniref:Uncharacterized protein n=1 Tax=Mythimna separata TaxID=271217 RepID=A0AAD8DWN4_MYTSE|nr:hypothetical protein PYW07_006623 [Mythimna separata]
MTTMASPKPYASVSEESSHVQVLDSNEPLVTVSSSVPVPVSVSGELSVVRVLDSYEPLVTVSSSVPVSSARVLDSIEPLVPTARVQVMDSDEPLVLPCVSSAVDEPVAGPSGVAAGSCGSLPAISEDEDEEDDDVPALPRPTGSSGRRMNPNSDEVTEEDYICEACFYLAMQGVNDELHGNNDRSAGSSHRGHREVCLLCGRSLVKLQSHLVLSPSTSSHHVKIAEIVERTIAPRQISSSDRLCHACFMKVKRDALRSDVHDEARNLAYIQPGSSGLQSQTVEPPMDAMPLTDPKGSPDASLIPPPLEPSAARLIGDDSQGPSFAVQETAGGYQEYTPTSERDIIDFKNVQQAFKLIMETKDNPNIRGDEDGQQAPSRGTQKIPRPKEDEVQSESGDSEPSSIGSTEENSPCITDMSAHDALYSLHLTATYLTLVMMRRITKRDVDLITAFSRPNIHKHYTDMVPIALGIALPAPSTSFNQAMSGAVSSSMEAGRHIGTILLYLMKSCTASSSDTPVGFLDQERIGMEAILKATCMTHIAGAGIPLATLFVAVRSLYNKSEWETIQWLSYNELLHSISSIITLRLDHFQLTQTKSDTVKLFPYCRLVHQNYHPDLSYRGNEEMCYFMVCLVDFKCPPVAGTGGARAAMWTSKMNPGLKKEIETVARAMYEETSKFTLTPMFSGQKSPATTKGPGSTWIPPEVTAGEEETNKDESIPTVHSWN